MKVQTSIVQLILYSVLIIFVFANLELRAFSGTNNLNEDAYKIKNDFANDKYTYKKALKNQYLSLNPALLDDEISFSIMAQLVECLVKHEDGEVKPALAQKWTISKDLKKYTFELDKSYKFSDGSAITSDDVVNVFYYLMNDNSVHKQDLAIIEGAKEYYLKKSKIISGISIIDKYSFSIRLSKPFAPFLSMITAPQFGILPQKSLLLLGKGDAIPFISSGAYSISFASKDGIYLDRNKFYKNVDKIYFKKIIYTIVKNKNEAIDGLITGKYHDVIPHKIEDSEIPNSAKEKVYKVNANTAGVWYLGFNLNDLTIKNKYLREFLRRNIDQDKYMSHMKLPESYKAINFIPRGLLGHTKEKIELNTDVQSMKNSQLLEKANCTKKNICKIEMIYTENGIDDALKALFLPLDDFSNVLKVKLVHLERREWFNRFIKQKYQLIYIGTSSVYADTYWILKYFSDSTFYPGIENKKIKKLLNKSTEANDKYIRGRLYEEIDKEIMKQSILIPLNYGVFPYYFVSSFIKGYDIPFAGYYLLKIKDLKYGE
ncbi:MAG: ABC transporter substrate-binding protein [Oligoflexia bacterium]|nr:ABC transporter substrate-binding protein [Oligoflexia bacterium]